MNAFTKGQNKKMSLLEKSRNLDKTGTVPQSLAHVYQVYTCCAASDHLVQAFCTGELCSRRVSIKLLPHYTFFENILIKGKARNKYRPVNKRKSSYTLFLYL